MMLMVMVMFYLACFFAFRLMFAGQRQPGRGVLRQDQLTPPLVVGGHAPRPAAIGSTSDPLTWSALDESQLTRFLEQSSP